MMEAATSPSSRTFQSVSSAMSTHTKIRLPIEEAVKAEFPPGCKVLCIDDNGFRVGIVRNVMVSISLPSQRTFGTFYEVEMKGIRSLEHNMNGIFTASDLRLTPDCPVEVNAEYFGEVFKFAGDSNGKVRGIVLGSFEVPTSRGETADVPRKFFYSVRVKFNGMEEAIEAHGVPPQHLSVYNCIESDLSTISDGIGSLMIGGGSFNQGGSFGGDVDEYKENNGFSDVNSKPGTPSRRLRRVTPEDVPMADFSNQPQENNNTNVNAMFQHESTTKSFSNSIASGGREIYDSEEGSSWEERRPRLASPKKQRGRSSSVSRSRSQGQTRTRSTSRMRTYTKPQPDRSVRPNAIPPHFSSAIESDDSTQEYRESTSVEEYEHEQPRREEFVAAQRETVYDDEQEPGRTVVKSPKAEHGAEIKKNKSKSKVKSKSTKQRPTLTIRNMDQYDISDEEDSGDRNYDDDREALAPTPETYDYDDAHEQIENVEVPEEEYSFEESNVYNEASFTTDDDQVASVEEEQFPVEPTPPSTPQVEKKAKKFGSTWTPSPRDTSKSTTIPPPLDTSSPATPTTEKKSKKFGSTWSPSPKNDSSHENKSYKSPASTPLRRNSSFSSVQSFNSVQKTISDTPSLESMTEGCYLLFDKQTGGRLTLQFAKSKVENAIGFWASGKEKKIQGFKFKQNQGRSELVKNLAGPDSKKKYFNGWCQFVKAAKSYNGFFCKFSKNAKIQVDVFVYFGETCEIVMIEDGQPFDVSLIDAVAVVPKGNTTFSGVRTGEYGTFLGRGDSAGASLAL